MTRLSRKLATLFKRRSAPASCDTGALHVCACDDCAFVDFFRSNGDGQTSRLQGFCRCPDGPLQDRPVPPERHCSHWEPSPEPVEKPRVGDPTLSV